MNPVVGAALIGGASSLVGGLVSSGEGKKNRRIAREQMKMQREFAQHGVRWRVADAQAAGIHPLAALGMQGLSYSPVHVPESAGLGEALADAGQNVARAVAAQMTPEQRQQQAMALALAAKQLEESDARILALRSEAARNMREANAAQTFPVPDPFWDQFGAAPVASVETVVPESVRPSGGISPKAPDVIHHTAGDTSTIAGVTPLWRSFQFGKNLKIDLPGGVSGDAAEVLESLAESPALMAIVVKHNTQKYGQEWGREWKRFIDGEQWRPNVPWQWKAVPEGLRLLRKFLWRRL